MYVHVVVAYENTLSNLNLLHKLFKNKKTKLLSIMVRSIFRSNTFVLVRYNTNNMSYYWRCNKVYLYGTFSIIIYHKEFKITVRNKRFEEMAHSCSQNLFYNINIPYYSIRVCYCQYEYCKSLLHLYIPRQQLRAKLQLENQIRYIYFVFKI